MLLKDIPGGLLVFSQPAHAWVSGELARAWGSDRFGPVEPFEETCLAAEQHDCGWLDWECRPSLNPASGRPLSFTELPTSEHLEIWSRGPRLAEVMNPYAGLVVSLHGTGLYARFHSRNPDPAFRTWNDEETARQDRLAGRLAREPRYAPFVTPAARKRAQALLATWDLLSLHFCQAGPPSRRVEGVPSASGCTDLEIRRTAEDAYEIDPWPFREPRLDLAIAGKIIHPPFESTETLQAALDEAPPASRTFVLHPRPARP